MTDPNPTGSHDNDPHDPFGTVEWEAYAAHARETLIPMVAGSAVTAFLATSAEPDVKQALELGMMILLDKPIIVILVDGQPREDLSRGLRRIANGFLDGPVTRPGFAGELATLMDRVSR